MVFRLLPLRPITYISCEFKQAAYMHFLRFQSYDKKLEKKTQHLYAGYKLLFLTR